MTDTTGLPATVEDLERALLAIPDPVDRARVAGMLADAPMRQMAARVRAEAIWQATRERGSAERVAERLATGVEAIRKAIKTHNASRKEEAVITWADLAAEVGLNRETGAERVAHWAGALTPHDPRTGRIPKPWTGQGMDYRLTRTQAEALEAEWHRDATHAERMSYLSYGQDPETEQLADRYRP